MIARSLDVGVLTFLLVGIGIVVVVQLWTLLGRLKDLSGQISYIAHLLEPADTKDAGD